MMTTTEERYGYRSADTSLDDSLGDFFNDPYYEGSLQSIVASRCLMKVHIIKANMNSMYCQPHFTPLHPDQIVDQEVQAMENVIRDVKAGS